MVRAAVGELPLAQLRLEGRGRQRRAAADVAHGRHIGKKVGHRVGHHLQLAHVEQLLRLLERAGDEALEEAPAAGVVAARRPRRHVLGLRGVSPPHQTQGLM